MRKEVRRRLVADRRDLVASIEVLLFRHDPIGINFEYNTDEYQPEAESIAREIWRLQPTES
ncbi:hypothetical protein [Amycolatopsis sp. NPDC102389]|uniref:hypothetical protein n=1 Tax=Amycolatopsis sp. NPDC102389 TaxID=3363941 RepID=UPI00381F9F96